MESPDLERQATSLDDNTPMPEDQKHVGQAQKD